MFTTVTYVTTQEPEVLRQAVVPDGEHYLDWIAQRDGLDHPNHVHVVTTHPQALGWSPIFRVTDREFVQGSLSETRTNTVGYIAEQASGRWYIIGARGRFADRQDLQGAMRAAKQRFHRAKVQRVWRTEMEGQS